MPTPPTTQIAAEKAAAIAAYCKDSTPTQDGWMACCPAHDDTHPSLSIGYTHDRVLLWCFAGCTFDEICAALGLKPADLFFGERWDHSPITDTYDYVDEHGTLLFQVCRTLDKKFPQRRPDTASPTGFEWGIKGIRRVLYHLPQLRIGIAAGRTIYLPEGEKDVHTVEALGLVATCNPMGAVSQKGRGKERGKGKWLPEYTEMLRGAHVALLPDHDEAGAEHVAIVGRHLATVAASVTLVPGIHTTKAGSDVTDWVTAGGTKEQLLAATDAAPPWTPAPLTFRAAAPPPTNGTHPPGTPTPPVQFDADRLYTDSYNARAFADAHWLNLRYCFPWKCWLVWTGTHWQRDTSGEVMRRAKETIKNLAQLLPTLDDKQAFALLAHIKSSLSTSKLKAMLESAQSEDGFAILPEALDRDLWLLNVANGTINLRTGKLREATRDDFITKCVGIKYNAQATCPRWEKFLNRVMDGKQGLVAFLHRAVGYSLTGATSEQCLFILHGPTKTGKTTFLARLRALLGPYSTQADMESFMHKERQEVRNDLADLAGARVVCAVEAQEGRRLNESLIKQLTGGLDQVKARFLFQEYFTYTPQYKVFIGTNHKPVIKDTDQAIWERIRLVPFIVQIPKEDRKKDFDATLHQEIEGILTWAVEGCKAWQRDKGLKEPPEVLNATEEYKQEMDIIGKFIAEKCTVEANLRVPAKELYDAYKAWCEDNGERWETQTMFGKKMTERGFEKKPSDGIKYIGLEIMKVKPKTCETSEDADEPVPF